MGEITYVRSSFAGGEWSQMAQGRFHDPKYRTALNTCLNVIPVETEGAVRRPGFMTITGGTTRGGAPGRVIKFDFQGNSPYTMEFTDGHLRLISGTDLVTTNDSAALATINWFAAPPSLAGVNSAVNWQTGDQIFFTFPDASGAIFQNRLYTVTRVNSQLFSLTDAVTGATISDIVFSPTAGSLANRVLDIPTPYVAGSWNDLRSMQTDNFAMLLHGTIAPQVLGVVTQPNAQNFATFAFGPAVFNDGPYLDPPTNGSLVTPNGKTGIVQLAVSFQAYSATVSYTAGAYVTSVSVNYISLVDQNLNFTPASNPTKWQAVSVASSINNGKGFLQTDIGRLVRLFSEPNYWVATTTYAANAVVSYNPTGLPGQTTYWQSLAGANTGNAPGTDLVHWEILELGGQIRTSPALWTWGRIVSLANIITTTSGGSGGGGGNPAIVAPFGNMTGNGGLAAAFDGNLNKIRTLCAQRQLLNTPLLTGTDLVFSGYVGMQFVTGVQIASVTVVPPSNIGLIGEAPIAAGTEVNLFGSVFFYGSNSLPVSATSGTLLGSAALKKQGENISPLSTGVSPVSIVSNNQTSTWTYLWVTITMQCNASVGGTLTATIAIDQIEFVATSTSSGGGVTTSTSGVSVELLGGPLLYTTPILTWQLGVYSGTTGFPTCGTYADGRIWLAGAIPNRVDASVANGIVFSSNGVASLNFAPTDQYANVLDSSGISAVFNAPDANPILWMLPDLQGILAGTQAAEWLVFSPTGGGFSPTNIAVRRTTRIGSANIEPTKTEHTVVFVQKFLRNVMEYFADIFSGKFTAPKLSMYALHLTAGNLQELAYQQELCPIVWARVDNNLRGCTYKRDTLMTSQGPTHMGWHRHALGSGWSVVSICTGSSVNGNLDALTIVSGNPTTGLYYVEVLTDILDETAGLAQGNYVDESVNPTSIVATNTPSGGAPYGGVTLNGLWYLNGFTVTAWLGGLDCGDYPVSNGSIFVPYGDGFNEGPGSGLFTANFVATGITANGTALFAPPMPTVVGFTYTSTVTITRPVAPEETGARAGPGFGKLRRSHYIIATLVGAQGVSFGSDGNFFPAMFTQADGATPYTIDLQFTGLFRDRFPVEYNFLNRIGWQVTRPYICNVTALGAALETADI